MRRSESRTVSRVYQCLVSPRPAGMFERDLEAESYQSAFRQDAVQVRYTALAVLGGLRLPAQMQGGGTATPQDGGRSEREAVP